MKMHFTVQVVLEKLECVPYIFHFSRYQKAGTHGKIPAKGR